MTANGHDSGNEKRDNVTPFRVPRSGGQNTSVRAAGHEPAISLPPMIKALCALLIVIHVVVVYVLPVDTANEVIYFGGFSPARLWALKWAGGILGLVTHMFLHGGWMHLGVNIAMLAAFGSALEQNIGKKRTAVLFIACGIAGALTHAAFYPSAELPLIGASGAISGLFGAVMRVLSAAGGGNTRLRGLLPLVLVWIGMSLFFGFFGMPGSAGPIAWTAHVGGFIAGLLLLRPVLSLR